MTTPGGTAPAEEKAGLPIVLFPSPESWEEWLTGHHDTSPGVWLMVAKKGGPTPTVTYAQALDVALCHGWIDSQKGAYDAHFFLQRFTPRGPRSIWSQINRTRIGELTAAGLMRPAGLAAVETARRSGRWDAAYAPQSTAEVPEDLRAALDATPAAAEFFATLSGANRYAVLFRVREAVRPETRARRIATFVAMLARHETLH